LILKIFWNSNQPSGEKQQNAERGHDY